MGSCVLILRRAASLLLQKRSVSFSARADGYKRRIQKNSFDKCIFILYTCKQVQTSICCEREEIGSSEPQRAGGW